MISVEPVLLLAASLAVVTAVCFVLLRNQRGLEQSVDSLQRQLSVFTEASIRVADTVDRAITADATPLAARSARRQLLTEARARFAAGRSPLQISAELGLSEEEQALLTALPPISEAGQRPAR